MPFAAAAHASGVFCVVTQECSSWASLPVFTTVELSGSCSIQTGSARMFAAGLVGSRPRYGGRAAAAVGGLCRAAMVAMHDCR